MKEVKNFEKKLKRLEEIVSLLEKEDQSLDQTVSLFKEGMQISKDCRFILSEVEQTITSVIGVDEDGNPQVEDFRIDNG